MLFVEKEERARERQSRVRGRDRERERGVREGESGEEIERKRDAIEKVRRCDRE